MSEWHEIENGYIRERADGTIEKHPYKYVMHEQFVFRTTYDPDTGQCLAVENHPPKGHALIESATGEIVAVHIGFCLDTELNGAPPFSNIPDGHAVVSLVDAVLPDDFVARRGLAGVHAWRWNTAAGMMERKSQAEIERGLTNLENAIVARMAAKDKP